MRRPFPDCHMQRYSNLNCASWCCTRPPHGIERRKLGIEIHVGHVRESLDDTTSGINYADFQITVDVHGQGDTSSVRAEPLSPVTQQIAVFEDQLYPAILLARLVSMQLAHSGAPGDEY